MVNLRIQRFDRSAQISSPIPHRRSRSISPWSGISPWVLRAGIRKAQQKRTRSSHPCSIHFMRLSVPFALRHNVLHCLFVLRRAPFDLFLTCNSLRRVGCGSGNSAACLFHLETRWKRSWANSIPRCLRRCTNCQHRPRVLVLQ